MDMTLSRIFCALGLVLGTIPSSWRTERVCRDMVIRNVHYFASVPPQCLSQAMCYAVAVHNRYKLTSYRDDLPFSLPGAVRERAEKLLARALKDYDDENPIPFANQPDEWFDENTMEFVLRCRGGFLALPDSRKSLEITLDAINRDPELFTGLSPTKQEEVVRKQPWRLRQVQDAEIFEKLYPFVMQSDYKLIDKIPTSLVTEDVVRACMQSIVDKKLPENHYEGMIDFIIDRRLRLELMPECINMAVSNYIVKTVSSDNFERFVDALKPDTYSHDHVGYVLYQVERQAGINEGQYPLEEEDHLDDKRLRFFRSKALCEFFNPSIMASQCRNKHHWIFFQQVYGTERAIMYNPGMKAQFVSSDLRV